MTVNRYDRYDRYDAIARHATMRAVSAPSTTTSVSSRDERLCTRLTRRFSRARVARTLAEDRDDAVSGCTECSLPNERARADAIARAMALPRNGHARALVIGVETGALAVAIAGGDDAAGCTALCVDASNAMLDRCAEALGRGPGGKALESGVNVLGNEHGVRFLRASDTKALKPYHGPFDAAAFNAHLVDRGDEEAIVDALTRVVMLCKPGGRVVISERPAGAVEGGVDGGFDFSSIVRRLPLAAVGSAGKDLSAQGSLRADDDENPLVLTIPKAFELSKRFTLEAPVVTGFGRGSKQMGVPTANLDPELCGGEAFLSTLPLGVFFGWAKLADESAWHECVLNVGKRPTFVDGDGTTIEVHVMGSTDATPEYDRDFYGETMRVDVCGFIRPELRFDSLPELVARIKTDIGLARNALASGAHAHPTE